MLVKIALKALLLASLFSSSALYAQNVKEPEWIYSLRPGETLWGICNKYCSLRNCWKKLSAYNQITADTSLPARTLIKIPVSWLKVTPMAATVLISRDATKVDRKNRQQIILPGDAIHLLDKLITGEHHAVVTLSNGSILSIAPDTELSFSLVSPNANGLMVDTNIELLKGSITTDVRKRSQEYFRINTPSAVAAVRGTTFSVNYDNASQTMITTVDDGLVNVSNKKNAVDIPELYATLARKNKSVSQPIKRLAKPTVTSKLNKPIALPSKVKWNAIPSAKHYKLWISKGSGLTSEPVLTAETTETSLALASDTLAPGEYFLNAMAIDENNINGLSISAAINIDIAKQARRQAISRRHVRFSR